MTTTISRSRLGQLVSATGQEFSFDTLVSRLTHVSICVQYDMSILDTIWVHVVDALDNDLLCYTDIRGEAYHYLLVASSFYHHQVSTERLRSEKIVTYSNCNCILFR